MGTDRVSRQKIVNAPRHRPNSMLEFGEEMLDKETAKLNEKTHALRVLQDLSEASLTRAMEESLAAFQVSLARLPGAEVSDQPNLLWSLRECHLISTTASFVVPSTHYTSMLRLRK